MTMEEVMGRNEEKGEGEGQQKLMVQEDKKLRIGRWRVKRKSKLKKTDVSFVASFAASCFSLAFTSLSCFSFISSSVTRPSKRRGGRRDGGRRGRHNRER